VLNPGPSPDQAGPSLSPIQGCHRLLLAYLQGRGYGFVVERKHGQCHPLLPDPGLELRFQSVAFPSLSRALLTPRSLARGLLQVLVRFQEGRRVLDVVRWQCRLRWCRWCFLLALRLLPRLRSYPSCERREVCQGWRRRAPIQRPRRCLPQDPQV
jgi:hypothetical protein